MVHSVEQNTDRKTLSEDEGSFAVENLQPGHYQLIATKGESLEQATDPRCAIRNRLSGTSQSNGGGLEYSSASH
jgi:hypothetical protein